MQVHTSCRKSMQVDASGWPNKAQVQNLHRLVSPFGQGLKNLYSKGGDDK